MGSAVGQGDGGLDGSARPAIRRIDLVREDIRRVGPLTINPPARSVRHDDGRSVTLEPRTMQLLVALLIADGAILARDDLIESCWEGRIVGDDSISSVMYRLRRDLRDLVAGVLEIETVTKVGFRIVRLAGAANAPPAAPLRAKAEPAVAAVTPAALPPRRARRLWPWAVFALLAIAAGLGWWLEAPPFARHQIALEPIRPLGSGLPRDLPVAIGSELGTRLAELGIPLVAQSQDLQLGGDIRRTGDAFALTLRLTDRPSGRTIWNRADTLPVGDEGALGRTTTDIANEIECGLVALDARHPELTQDGVALFFRYCATSAGTGQDLELARQMTQAEPRFVGGWFGVALAASAAMMSGRDDPGLRREGLAAADRVIALRPDIEEGYVGKAQLLEPVRAAERERLFRTAIGKTSLLCACAEEFFGDFLVQGGRAEEALAVYRRALARYPRRPITHWRVIMALDLTGRQYEAGKLLDAYEARYGPSPAMRFAHAIRRDPPDRSVPRPPYHDPTLERAATAAYAALAGGDAAARRRAAADLATVPLARETEVIVASLMAQLGDIDGALRVIEASRARGMSFAAPGRFAGITTPLAWNPYLAPVWRDPRFALFLQQAGFMRYWRETRSRPDVCGREGPPDFCRAI